MDYKERIKVLIKRKNNLTEYKRELEQDSEDERDRTKMMLKSLIQERTGINSNDLDIELVGNHYRIERVRILPKENLILGGYPPTVDVDYRSDYNHDHYENRNIPLYTYKFSDIKLRHMEYCQDMREGYKIQHVTNLRNISAIASWLYGNVEEFDNIVSQRRNLMWDSEGIPMVKVGLLLNIIEREIAQKRRDIEVGKIKPYVIAGNFFKREYIDDNGSKRSMNTRYFHIFKLTAKCVFYNEFNENGRNTRKDDSYWNENMSCRRVTHDEFYEHIRNSQLNHGMYRTKEFTPNSHERRTYGGYISKIEV